MLEKNQFGNGDSEGLLDIETILYHGQQRKISWTMPRLVKTDDIIFFFHAKFAFKKIRSTIKEAKLLGEYNGDMKKALDKAELLHKKYGGKIFSIARVGDSPQYFGEDDQEYFHFKGRVFGGVSDVQVLKNPVSLEQFSQFIFLSRQSSITPIFGDSFDRLKRTIENSNDLPIYLKNSRITDLPIREVDENNWIQSGILNGRRYILEAQFREYYVNYLLKSLSDDNYILFECHCYKNNERTGIVDNAIKLKGKMILIEVKLSVKIQSNITLQFDKYIGTEYINPKNGKGVKTYEKLFTDNILVIDTENLYMYSGNTEKLYIIENLENLAHIDDVSKLKDKISSLIFQLIPHA